MLVREHGPRGAQRRQADLRGQPRGAGGGRRATRATGCVQADICDRAGRGRGARPRSRPTRSCIWRPRAMSTARSTARRLRPDQRRRHLRAAGRRAGLLARAAGRPAGRGFRFVHVSTDEVYGSLGAEGRFTEATRYDPNSPYAASKAAADHLARAWHRTYGLPVIVTNCSNNYGPYQFPEKLIPLDHHQGAGRRAAAGLRQGRERARLDPCRGSRPRHPRRPDPRPGGRGLQFRRRQRAHATSRWSSAICAAVDELQPEPGGPGARAADQLRRRPAGPRRPLRHRRRQGAAPSWAGRRGASFEQGLAATVRWYLEHRAWWEAIRAGRYGGERLGLGEAARGPCAPRLLVTGANGQLGRELLTRGRARGFAIVGLEPRASSTSPTATAVAAGRRRRRRRHRGQCRRLHRGRPGGERAATGPSPSTPKARAMLAEACAARGPAADPRLDRLRVRRHQARGLCRGRPGGAARRLRRQQGGRRARGARGAARRTSSCAPPGSTARTAATSS